MCFQTATRLIFRTSLRSWPDRYSVKDDWGCGWQATDVENMGQVKYHPLEDWDKLSTYRPPDPRDRG